MGGPAHVNARIEFAWSEAAKAIVGHESSGRQKISIATAGLLPIILLALLAVPSRSSSSLSHPKNLLSVTDTFIAFLSHPERRLITYPTVLIVYPEY
jgi:hypothetical protein